MESGRLLVKVTSGLEGWRLMDKINNVEALRKAIQILGQQCKELGKHI